MNKQQTLIVVVVVLIVLGLVTFWFVQKGRGLNLVPGLNQTNQGPTPEAPVVPPPEVPTAPAGPEVPVPSENTSGGAPSVPEPTPPAPPAQ